MNNKLELKHVWRNFSEQGKRLLFMWLLFGWTIFIASFFVLPQQATLKITFYLFLLLPSLLLIPYWVINYKNYQSSLLNISFLFALYMATTLFWSGEPWRQWFGFFYKQVVFIFSWLLNQSILQVVNLILLPERKTSIILLKVHITSKRLISYNSLISC